MRKSNFLWISTLALSVICHIGELLMHRY